MTTIAPAAAAARENARTTGGQFGEQHRDDAPAGVLTVGPLTEEQRRTYGDLYTTLETAERAMAGGSNDVEYDALSDTADSIKHHLTVMEEAGEQDSSWYASLLDTGVDIDEALDAESNDAEHEALVDAAHTLGQYLAAKGVPTPGE